MSKRKEVKEEDGAKSVVGVERERERRGQGGQTRNRTGEKMAQNSLKGLALS